MNEYVALPPRGNLIICSKYLHSIHMVGTDFGGKLSAVVTFLLRSN
jgi:hypothetical protein